MGPSNGHCGYRKFDMLLRSDRSSGERMRSTCFEADERHTGTDPVDVFRCAGLAYLLRLGLSRPSGELVAVNRPSADPGRWTCRMTNAPRASFLALSTDQPAAEAVRTTQVSDSQRRCARSSVAISSMECARPGVFVSCVIGRSTPWTRGVPTDATCFAQGDAAP